MGFELRIFLISLLLLALFVSTEAKAGNEPIFASAPDWVEKPQTPALDPSQSERPYQLLLFTVQNNHEPDRQTIYFETLGKIQSAETLTAAGTISIPWQPERSELIIHKVEVIRDGVIRDVLAAQKFSILRRESNLEAALVDGTLTATIQPEDLRVGDVVHLAYSVRAKPDSIGFKPEDSIILSPGTKANLVLLREIWPDAVPMRWVASPRMGKLKERKTKLGNELRVELRNFEAPRPPQSSPPRFAYATMLEATTYRDWTQVSTLLAPLYAKASSLPENSPLKTEARLIAVAAQTPKARALAALRLVQDKIRYLALQMNEGGYIPASADETWTRRFGDCKGKTAALLALLKELGIEAEPVLVNSYAGDMLPYRLPRARLFNHVIVHATIDGKSYWLDGARMGDRNLEELASSRFRHGLPLRSAGATLVELPFAPPLEPLVEVKTTYDASEGLFVPVKRHEETVFRGAAATAFRLALAQVGEAELKKRFERDRPLPGRTVSFKADADQETFTIILDGRDKMDWSKKGEPPATRFQFKDSAMQWRPVFNDRDGANANVPFLLDNPYYSATREEVILPNQGKGFSLQGKSFDRTVAGTRITRSLSLENGRAVASSDFIRIQPELSVAEAKAGAAAIAELGADAAYIVAPMGVKISEPEVKPIIEGEPVTANEYVDRGFRRQERLQMKDAMADFDRAIELAPESSLAHARRALLLIQLGRLDEAEVEIEKAHSVKNVDPRSTLAQGLLNARRGRPEQAITDFTHYLEYNRNSGRALYDRALAYEKIGQLTNAQADLQRVLAIEPKSYVYVVLARVTARLGKVEEAMAIVDKAAPGLDDPTLPAWKKTYALGLRRGRVLRMAGRPEDERAQYVTALRNVDARLKQVPAPKVPSRKAETVGLFAAQVDLLARLGRTSDAITAADEGLAMHPENSDVLVQRCLARLRASVELGKARQDCDAARRSDPANLEASFANGLLSLKSKDWDRAAKEFAAAGKGTPSSPRAMFGLGIAVLPRGGPFDNGAALALARELSAEVDSEFQDFGITPEITSDTSPAKTLQGMTLFTWRNDGRTSNEAKTPEDFVSRGYDHYEKQQFDDALADYDRALQLAPDSSLAYSLRALVLIRLARLDEAERAIGMAFSREAVEPRSFQVRGLLNARRGRLPEAIQDLSHGLTTADRTTAVWLLERGLAYERIGQFEKAQADLKQVVELFPQLQQNVALARVTARLGKVQEAMDIVDKATPGANAPNMRPWTKTHLLAKSRGKVLRAAGRFEQARVQYDAALGQVDLRLEQLPAPEGPVLSGETLNLLLTKVDILADLDRGPEAIAVADRALAIQPDNVAMLLVRCLTWLRTPDQTARARQDCDAAGRYDPSSAGVEYVSALVSLKLKDWQRATMEFAALTEKKARVPKYLYGRGVAKTRAGQETDGKADIELARLLNMNVDVDFEEYGIKP